MLIRAALERYPEYTPAAQRAIGDAVYWLCDGMLEEIKNDAASNYYRMNLECVKHAANDMVKRTLSSDELDQVRADCRKLLHHPTDPDNP